MDAAVEPTGKDSLDIGMQDTIATAYPLREMFIVKQHGRVGPRFKG